MAIILYLVAIMIGGLGVMYITGKGLDKIVSPNQVDESRLRVYMRKYNATAVSKFIGINLIASAVYMIITATAMLLNIFLIFTIATAVAAVYAIGMALYFSVSKRLRRITYEPVINEEEQTEQ